MSRKNKKLLDVPDSFLYDSGLQVKFLSLSLISTDSSKITSIFYDCILPTFLIKVLLALGPKLLAAGGGELSQQNRRLQVLAFERVTIVTFLTGSHNGLHFISPSLGAHRSSEKGTQHSAFKLPQWWISLESGKLNNYWKQTKLNRPADATQKKRGSPLTCTTAGQSHSSTLIPFTGLLLTILTMNENAVWSSADTNFIWLWVSESEQSGRTRWYMDLYFWTLGRRKLT